MKLSHLTIWNEKAKWLIIPNIIMIPQQTVGTLPDIHRKFNQVQPCYIKKEFTVTQIPQPKRMNFKEGRERIRELSQQAELRRKEYLKKRGGLLSFLDYDDE